MPDPRELKQQLQDLDLQRARVQEELDRDRLTTATNNLLQTITSAPMMERMREFREKAAAGEVKTEEAVGLMSLEELRAAGAKLPEDFRLTSRVFEDLESGSRVEIHDKLGDLIGDRPGPAGWSFCAGGGAATVCGCAGGGS
jgi:hypothetical protein